MKIVKPFIRTPYNYDREAASAETGLLCVEPSLAVQSQKDDADINVIVRRFGLTGTLPENVRVPTYGDFSEVVDFQSAMNVVRQAQEAFDELPSDVRLRFNNDPQRLIEFLNDEANLDEAVRLGIAVAREPAVESPPSDVVPDPVIGGD